MTVDYVKINQFSCIIETATHLVYKARHYDMFDNPTISLPKGSIEKLIGRKLTWEDEPVELKETE